MTRPADPDIIGSEGGFQNKSNLLKYALITNMFLMPLITTSVYGGCFFKLEEQFVVPLHIVVSYDFYRIDCIPL